MKSRVMLQTGDRRIVEEEWQVPPMRASEAILEVEACGICGSDVEQYRGTFVANGITRYPFIPGHEPIGRIVDIGADAARIWGVKTGTVSPSNPICRADAATCAWAGTT